MDEEIYEPEIHDTHLEVFVPVEAYALKNIKAMALALGIFAMLPTASAMHNLDHEYE